MLSFMSSCPHDILSLCHLVIVSLCHYVIIFVIIYVTMSSRLVAYFWQILAAFDNFCQQLETFGNFWLLLAPFATFCQLSAIFVNFFCQIVPMLAKGLKLLAFFLTTCCNIWVFVVDHFRYLLASFGNIWQSLAMFANFFFAVFDIFGNIW